MHSLAPRKGLSVVGALTYVRDGCATLKERLQTCAHGEWVRGCNKRQSLTRSSTITELGCPTALATTQHPTNHVRSGILRLYSSLSLSGQLKFQICECLSSRLLYSTVLESSRTAKTTRHRQWQTHVLKDLHSTLICAIELLGLSQFFLMRN